LRTFAIKLKLILNENHTDLIKLTSLPVPPNVVAPVE